MRSAGGVGADVKDHVRGLAYGPGGVPEPCDGIGFLARAGLLQAIGGDPGTDDDFLVRGSSPVTGAANSVSTSATSLLLSAAATRSPSWAR